MNVKLVADSSANSHTLKSMDVTYVPLKIVTDDKEYVDTADLDVAEMLHDLRKYKGKSGTACPGVGDWLNAFQGADVVLGAAITSNLSGCYNAAAIAAEEYTAANPNAKVFILDTLSTGPEMQLILEKYQELIEAGKDFEEIVAAVKAYHARTHLLFSLESIDNLAKNGRANAVVAKAVGILGIRIVGRAGDEGTLEPIHKCRGEKRALRQLLASMKDGGYHGGKVRISHSCNPEAAEALAAAITESYPQSDIAICCNGGLCCFYAEEGGILLGFES